LIFLETINFLIVVEQNVKRSWHVTRWKYFLTRLRSSTYAFCTHRGAVSLHLVSKI